jgi:putative restriction endonuclease
MAFWWVFQGKSYERAKQGQYLWAPQQNNKGQTKFHWTNMTKVQPGDVIFSGYEKQLVAVSLASGVAYECDPPDERDVPDWPSRGWRIDVAFSELRSPLAYSGFLPSILNALPERYAPFDRNTGRSNLGYLFALPDDAGQILVDEIENREPLFLERAITTEYADKNDAPTTRDALVAARMGQGKFRADLETIWDGGCALCKLTRRELLRASHIKPWSASNNAERLDPYNGLLLAVGYDGAFDNLLITLDETGALLLAPDFSLDDAAAVGIDPNARLRIVHPRHLPYLEEHRTRFYRRASPLAGV